MPRVVLFSVVAVCLSVAVAAHADTLSMQTSLTITASADKVRAEVRVTNKGSATAYRVQARLLLDQTRLKAPEIARIKPGQTQTVEYEKAWKTQPKGEFPAVLLLTYQDEAGYPFSALHCAAFQGTKGPEPDIAVQAQDFVLAGEGRLVASASRQGQGTVRVRVRCVLPNELAGNVKTATLNLSPGREETVGFRLTNRYALPGATYPVYLLFEYDEEGVHHTAVTHAVATIAFPETWFRRTRSAWIVAGALLVAALIGTAVYLLRKKPGA